MPECSQNAPAMTYYHQQLIKIRQEIYPKDYLVEQVIQAKVFIDGSFAKNITLNDISAAACFSKFHFVRLFKMMYGRTPYQYLTAVRIEQAKKLLQTNRSIAEVCLSVGFESISSFAGLFKKITGFTPASLLKKQNKRTDISVKNR